MTEGAAFAIANAIDRLSEVGLALVASVLLHGTVCAKPDEMEQAVAQAKALINRGKGYA